MLSGSTVSNAAGSLMTQRLIRKDVHRFVNVYCDVKCIDACLDQRKLYT